jgi:hypothetical protein
MKAALFFGGRGYGKGLGIPAGFGFIGLGVYKHSNEKHEEMN